MKYEAGDILYYVCPFVFTIEKVKIDYAYKEEDGTIYYIESSGGYLYEYDLFNNLEDARNNALKKLEDFFRTKNNEIMNSKPNFNEGYF